MLEKSVCRISNIDTGIALIENKQNCDRKRNKPEYYNFKNFQRTVKEGKG
jgi:hypothetical protein